MTEPMLALSIRQPWAWAIIHGGKDVENRSENVARRAERLIGQTILIHAGLRPDADGFVDMLDDFGLKPSEDDLHYGGVIGSARIMAVTRRHPSRWAQRGQWRIVLTDARPRPFRPCRGPLGFFRVES